MTFDDLKSRLRNVKEHGQYKITASCPCGRNHSHDDKNSSFSATYDPHTRKILVYCHAGCSIDEICGALGCGPDELMPEPTEQERQRSFLEWYAGKNALRLEAVYSYCYGTFTDGLAKARFRTADGKKDFRWIKTDGSQKSGFKMTHSGCPHRLYVRGDLETASRCFVVEGEKDADTLFTLTRTPTVSAENGATKGGDAGGKWLAEYTQQLEGKDVYILWDNDPKTDPKTDPAGLNFAKIEAQALEGHAARLFMLDITEVWPDCPEKGDITDMVEILGAKETADRLRILIQNTPERPHSAQEAPQQAPGDLDGEREAPAQEAPQGAPQAPQRARSAVELFDSFMAKIQTDVYRPIPTGMAVIDDLLRGGIPRQAVVLLLAAPAAGKTALAQQMFETAAAHGTDVIFLNLEMSQEQLLSRSLSRMIHRDGGNIPADVVMEGYAWTEAQRRFIEPAAARYRAEIAPHMDYNPDGCGADLDSIMDTLNRAGEAAKAAGKPAPAICLDYLHLVRVQEARGDLQEMIKIIMGRLKSWAIQYDSYVLAISATNRTANSNGKISLYSGRDSSNLEYGADIVLSLNYKEVHEHGLDANDPDVIAALEKKDGTRDMIIQVLKNRMKGNAGQKRYLSFHAASGTFTATTDQTPPPASLRQMGFIEINDPDLPDF